MGTGRIADPQPVRRRRRIEAEGSAGAAPATTGPATNESPTGEYPVVANGAGPTGGTTPSTTSKSQTSNSTVPKPGASKAGTPKSGVSTSRDRTPKPGSLRSLAVSPDISGPRVRLGVLWFLLAMAAATAGRTWSAAFWALVAGKAALEIVAAWHPHHRLAVDGSEGPVVGSRLPELVAFLFAASVPVAAGWGTGTGGLVLIAVSLVSLAVALVFRSRGGWVALPVGVILPAITAGAVVMVVRSGLWAGIFLIAAVSMFDAGSFLAGAESSSRLEGPVVGGVGALAVTFTLAVFQAPPFDTLSAAVTGVVVAVSCPIGQFVASAFLPSPGARAPAFRRLDAYLLAAPLFLASVWMQGG